MDWKIENLSRLIAFVLFVSFVIHSLSLREKKILFASPHLQLAFKKSVC